MDLRCFTFSLSTLHVNVFPCDSLFKKRQTTNVVLNLVPKYNVVNSDASSNYIHVRLT